MKHVRLKSKRGVVVLLDGIAADQWRTLGLIRNKSERISAYLEDVKQFASSDRIHQLAKDTSLWSTPEEYFVQVIEFGQARLLYVVYDRKIIVFFLSKIFFGHSIQPEYAFN